MCNKNPEFVYLEPDLKPHVDRRVTLLEENNNYQEKKLLYVIEKLLQEENELMGEKRTVTDVLRTAKVPVNVMNRLKSESGYYGPREEGCMRIGLAIGCNIDGIDAILLARGFAPLNLGGGPKYEKYAPIVKALLLEEEMPLADRVTYFKERELK